MDTDEKDKGMGTSGGTGSVEENDDMQDVIDLLDSTFGEDEEAQEISSAGGGLGQEEGEEDLIDLIDVVDEISQEEEAVEEGAAELEGGEELLFDLETPEDEGLIELVDEVKEEVAADDEGVIELTDLVEEQVFEAEGEEALGFSDADLAAEEADEDRLPEDLGVEIPEEPLEISLTDELGEPEEPAAAVAEPEPMAGVPAEVTPEALESMVAARLSDERIEEIITRVVKETIEKKADKVLIEVAEEAIAKEIKRLKQAL